MIVRELQQYSILNVDPIPKSVVVTGSEDVDLQIMECNRLTFVKYAIVRKKILACDLQ